MDVLHMIFWLTCTLVMSFHGLVGLWKSDRDPNRLGVIMKASPEEPGRNPQEPGPGGPQKVKPKWLLSSWQACGSGGGPLSIRNVSLSHDDGDPGQLLHVTWRQEVSVNLTTPVTVQVSVQRRLVSEVWLPMPCSQGFGSCNHSDVCALMTKPCPAPWGNSAIIQPGAYEVSVVAVAPLPPRAPFWLADSGHFLAKVELRDSADLHLLCLSLDFSSL